MKSLFPGYYNYSEVEFKRLWETSAFVFDTNIFLDLYRLSNESSDELYKVFDKIGDRIWAPYHVALEYHNNIFKVLSDQISKYSGAIRTIEDIKTSITDTKNHPFLSKEGNEKFNEFYDAIVDDLKNQQTKIQKLLLDNELKDNLALLLEGKIGSNLTEGELSYIETEGAERFSRKIPPGHKDQDKDTNKYGDLIIWKEIIKHSKDSDVDIILVTRDVKEDWFLKVAGWTVCPRPELVKEFTGETSHKIYIYSLEGFLRHMNKYIEDSKVTEAVIQEIAEQIEKDRYNQTESEDVLNNDAKTNIGSTQIAINSTTLCNDAQTE